MSDSLDAALSQAFELIEANRIDEARAILEPLLDEYPEDTELLWVYAHAVDDPAKAKVALQKAVELDDRFEDAKNLLQQIEGGPSEPARRPAAIGGIKPLAPPPPGNLPDLPSTNSFDDMPDSDDDFGDDFDEFDDFEGQSSSGGGNQWLIFGVAGLFAVVIVVILVFALLNSGGGQGQGTPTQIAQNAETETSTPGLLAPEESVTPISATAFSLNATDTEPSPTEESTVEVTEEPTATDTEVAATEEPTETPEPTATDTDIPPTETDTPTPEPTEDPNQALVDSLDDFELSGAEPSRQNTNLGDTLLIEVCLDSDIPRNELLNGTLTALAGVSEDVDPAIDAVGVTLFDCDSEDVFRAIAVPVETLQEFNNGTIELSEFQASWVAVG